MSMEVASKREYNNSIYSAIIVNEDHDADPEGKDRVQIYIPSIHFDLADIYADYMTDGNKEENEHWGDFPWAVPMVDDLENGNVVYGSYINNTNDEYIVLGLEVNNIANSKHSNDGLDISGELQGILDLTMPIVIHNEVGIATSDWPDGIATKHYTNINPYDNGGWSIGLIQWHHCRAFDCLYQICKADGDWENKTSDKNMDLYKDLKSSIKNNSTTGYRTKYQSSFHPTSGTTQYKFIQNLLGSSIGQETQRKYAGEDTMSSIETLCGDPYNISNPAIIIWLADIMNQYGPNLPSTIKKAAAISGTKGDDYMGELNEFRTWCKSNLGSYSKYISRRNTTYSYIENLDKDGKLRELTNYNLVDLDGADGGQLLWPSPGCQVITSPYGNRKNPTGSGYQFHTGVDLARNGGAAGQEIIAAHSGTIETQDLGNKSYGTLTKIVNGNVTTYYAHQSKRASGIKTGVTVKGGQLIGYVGSTGNSTGPHLHFEVRIDGKTKDPVPYIKSANGQINTVDTIAKKSSASGTALGKKIVEYAKTFIGCRYIWGNEGQIVDGKRTFDCSGFTQFVFGEYGIDLPRVSKDQKNKGTEIITNKKDYAKLNLGDLVHFTGHVGIYIGNNEFIHASNSSPYPKGGVKISKFSTYSSLKFIRATRVI